MDHDRLGTRILQVVAILFMLFICLVYFHKGSGDTSALMHLYPDDFWRELAKYLLGNMA
jgi:hypothetical protein